MKQKPALNMSDMTLCALMCAVMCILCPLAIPVGPVPVTLGVFAVYLAAYALGSLRAAIACLLYVLLGATGLPVFSGYTGGIGRLLGPTGGYLTGYLFLALIAGWFITHADRSVKEPDPSPSRGQTAPAQPSGASQPHHPSAGRLLLQFTGLILGLAVCYLFGTIWFTIYKHADGMTFTQALTVCVTPFLPFDALKIAAALVAGNAIRTALKRIRPGL